jgi:hypothetical protein
MLDETTYLKVFPVNKNQCHLKHFKKGKTEGKNQISSGQDLGEWAESNFAVGEIWSC